MNIREPLTRSDKIWIIIFMKAITGRQVTTAQPGTHRVQGTPGLFVLVHASGARSWIYRGWDGAREIRRGLGSVIDVALTDAKRAVLQLRAGIVSGAADLPRRTARTVQAAAAHTWQDAFDRLMDARSIRQSTADSYRSTWRVHCAPVLGGRDVAKTSREDVINLIASTSGSAPKKVRKVLAMVADVAVAAGWIAASPAGAAIKAALPAAARQSSDGQYASMPHAMIAGWFRTLADSPVCDAIRVLAMTALRPSDVTNMEWNEVDLDGATLTVSGDRHKSGADFRLPLSNVVIAILERQRGRSERYVFPSTRTAGPVSLPTVRRRMHSEYDLHGLRASFSTWTAETGRDSEVRETCLAHKVGDQTERAYQRSDRLAARRLMLTEWADYLAAAK